MSDTPTARRIAVIGASSHRHKYGNRAVRAFRSQGYEVLPINPHEAEVEGLTAYRSVLDVPGEIDMASFYVPPDVGLRVIDEIARKGIKEVWFNPGAESAARRKRAMADLGRLVVLLGAMRSAADEPELSAMEREADAILAGVLENYARGDIDSGGIGAYRFAMDQLGRAAAERRIALLEAAAE